MYVTVNEDRFLEKRVCSDHVYDASVKILYIETDSMDVSTKMGLLNARRVFPI